MLTGNPIANAILAFEGTDKTTTANLLGHYRLVRVLPGDYNLTITATGYPGKTMLVHIDRGRVDTLNIQMEV